VSTRNEVSRQQASQVPRCAGDQNGRKWLHPMWSVQ
jgi:hypothetical protein